VDYSEKKIRSKSKSQFQRGEDVQPFLPSEAAVEPY
jgi:hypothetical protein